MRPAGKGKLDSLYFDYPNFEFRRPPEMSGETTRHAVAVVGAGPIGMTAALELARQGVACVLLDNKTTLNDGSRAICVSRNSFETLQQLGAVESFEAKALGWTHGRCYYRNEMIYRLEMPHSDNERFMPMYNIQQQYIEQFLVDRIAAFPDLIDLRWQNEVVDVTQAEGEVTLTVKTPAGSYALRADYLLAADGAKSQIRKRLGLRLQGKNLPGNYVIADIQMEHNFPTERRSFFESQANPDSTILVHRQPDNIWRVDWQVRPHQDRDDAMSEETIRSKVQAIVEMIGHTGPWELEWWSIYTANTLCLDEYRHGRIFFIGDAAHIVPIFGVRGLNNGITDAANAAWKLAYVLRGEANDQLLDSYSPERRGATLDVFQNAGKSSRFMTPPSRGFELMRKAALQLALTEAFAKRFADPRQVEPYTYADSPLTSHCEADAAFEGGIGAGDVAVNYRLDDSGFLLDHLATGFTGLYFTYEGRVPKEIKVLSARLNGLDRNARVLVVTPLPIETAEDSMATLQIAGDSQVFEGYGASEGTFYLLRPDRHVAARWLKAAPDEVEQALRKMLTGAGYE